MNTFLNEKRRWPLLAVLLGAACSLVAVLVVVWVVARPDSKPTAVGKPSPEPSAAISQAAGPFALIKGGRTVEGISVGFPHSTAGAVSAAAEYLTRVVSNLDENRARTIAGVIADRSFDGAAAYLAQGPTNVRRTLGVAPTGPVPSGVSVTFGPAAYQLRAATPDSMTVLILAYYTTSTSDAGVKSTVGVYPMDVRWDGQDWKVRKPDASKNADYVSLAAQPGSTQAKANGWLELSP
jgi:hypothetical protein